MSQVMRFKKFPLAVQQEIVARFREHGFGDYCELSEELRRRGFRISKSSLHRLANSLRDDADFLKEWALRAPEQAAMLRAAIEANALTLSLTRVAP